MIRESVGASPYGGDLNKIPSRIVDAFIILTEEHNRVENMRLARKAPPQHQEHPQMANQRYRR